MLMTYRTLIKASILKHEGGIRVPERYLRYHNRPTRNHHYSYNGKNNSL